MYCFFLGGFGYVWDDFMSDWYNDKVFVCNVVFVIGFCFEYYLFFVIKYCLIFYLGLDLIGNYLVKLYRIEIRKCIYGIWFDRFIMR